MIDTIVSTLKPASIVSLLYTMQLESANFSDLAEQRGLMYGVAIADIGAELVDYHVYHLSATQLQELCKRLPGFLLDISNFGTSTSAETATTFLITDNNHPVVTVPQPVFDTLSSGNQELIFKEIPGNIWHFLRTCRAQSTQFLLDNQAVCVEALRFSDSTPNILASCNIDGTFSSKIVFSLDAGVETQPVLLDAVPSNANIFTSCVENTAGGLRFAAESANKVSLSTDDFEALLSTQLLSVLLNAREYYKTIANACELVKFYHKLLHPAEVGEARPSDYTETQYLTNCRIQYDVSRPRVSMLKKPKHAESQEEFVAQVTHLMSNPAYAPEFYYQRQGDTALTAAFLPMLQNAILKYLQGGLEAVKQLENAIDFRRNLYSLEVFRWKSEMILHNTTPSGEVAFSMAHNAVSAKFGVLRIALEVSV